MTLLTIAVFLLAGLYVILLLRMRDMEHALGDFANFIYDINAMMKKSAEKLKEIRKRLEEVFAKKVKKVTKKVTKK